MLLAAFTAQLVMRRQPSTPNWMVAISLRLALPLASGNVDQPAHADPGEAPARAEEAGGAERETGPFGPIYTGLTNQPEAAIEKLMAEKQGEVPDAFTHPELGAIAFVYGDEKMGLRHIAEKRGAGFLRSIPAILKNGNVVRDDKGLPRTYLVHNTDPKRVAVIRLDWDGQQKTWLVTAYQDDDGKLGNARKENPGELPKGISDQSTHSNPPFLGDKVGAGQANPTTPVTGKPAGKLTDFGEKLEGNRKDLPPSLKDELSDDQIATQPLSKSWPADAHEAIEDATAAALTFAARQEVTAKPRVAHKLRAWVAQVKMLRDMVRDPDDAQRFIAQGEAVKNVRGLEHFFTKVRLLTQIPREHWKRIGKVAEYPNARRAKPKSEMESLGWRYVYAGAPGKAGEIAKATGVYAGYVRQNEDGTWRGMTKAEEQSQWVRP